MCKVLFLLSLWSYVKAALQCASCECLLLFLPFFFISMKCIARKFVKWTLSFSLYSMCMYRDVITITIVKHGKHIHSSRSKV